MLPGPTSVLDNVVQIQQIEALEPAEAFCFAVAGDIHSRTDALDWLIEEVDTNDYAFFVLNGDITHRGEYAEYARVAEHLQTAEAPVITVKGNHDIRGSGEEFFENTFGKTTDFTFTYSNNKFIILDTAQRRLSEAQAAWFARELAESSDAIADEDAAYGVTIAITHVPLALDADLVIASHVHEPREYDRGDTHHLITPALGGKLYHRRDFYGYNRICMDEDGYEIATVKAPRWLARWESE